MQTDVPHCEWFGVNCIAVHTSTESSILRVQSMILHNNHLTGTIPWSLGNLSQLTYL